MAHRQQVDGIVEVLVSGENVYPTLLSTHKTLLREWILEAMERERGEVHTLSFESCAHPKCVALKEGRYLD